jgi:hypothetical protein
MGWQAHRALPDLAAKDDLRLGLADLKADLKAEMAAIRGDIAGLTGRMSNLPSAAQLLFMQLGIILAIFAGAFGLLKLTGHG